MHRAAVITPREITYGRGTAVPAHPEIGQDLLKVLEGTVGRFEQHSTIVIDGVSPATYTAQSEAARAAGWNHADLDGRAWTLYHREDGRTVAVGLRDAMSSRHLGVLFDKETDPGVVAINLDRYCQVTGNPWRGTPATSALNAIRLSWGNSSYQPLWQHPRLPVHSEIGFCFWSRPLNDNERWWGYVHTFDANSAYLGSAVTAELAWSHLHHAGPQQFDAGLPGYWQVALDQTLLETLADPDRPPLISSHRDGAVWMTTPYMKLLQDLGYHGLILDSWTGRAEYRESGARKHPAAARVLRSWGENLRNGLRGVSPAVEDAAKRTYKDAVGGMQRQGMRVSRRDWGETIIDLWRATLFRRILRIHTMTGCWPVRIATDSISYADSNPDPSVLALAIHGRAGIPLLNATGLGQFHHEETVTTEQWLTRYPVTQRARRPRRRVTK